MTLVAGIDVGNTTTEIVLAEVKGSTAEPVRWARTLTVGDKGSDASLHAAARLLERLESALGSRSAMVAIAALCPVSTNLVELPHRPREGGPVQRLDAGQAATPSGSGFARGSHVPIAQLSAEMPPGELIVSVSRNVDYEDAAAILNNAAARGVRIAGIVAAGDDAVLIGNRLSTRVPIVDELSLEDIGYGDVLAMEVAPVGEPVRVLGDPVALAVALGLQPNGVALVARDFADARCGVLAVRPTAVQSQAPESWVEYLDRDRGEPVRMPLLAELHELATCIEPGSVRALCLRDVRKAARVGEHKVDYTVRDIFAPDLLGLGNRTYVRRGSVEFERAPLSVLREVADGQLASARLPQLIGPRVVVPVPEADAAALGACSTPVHGASAALVAVCDLGGGTIDLIAPGVSITAAGAGELLTVSVANVLGIRRDIAERVKRHPSLRIETPRIAHYESGERAFLDAPAAPDALGRLCVMGKQGPWPFHSDLAPEEWRLLRLALKARTMGANIERCLALLKDPPSLLLLCGGAALDNELVRTLSDTLSERGTVVGRANVAGRLGPRYAVALGLAMAAAR